MGNRGPGFGYGWKKKKSSTPVPVPGYYWVTKNWGTTYISNYILIFFSLGLVKSSLGT